MAKHEHEFLANRSPIERLGDAIATFAGSLVFVFLHLLAFACWIGVNTVQIGHIPHFDPAPFTLLGNLVTLEAILLSSFILMRQARLGRRSDERDQLMLQMLLLMERETTATLGMERQIAARVGLVSEANASDVTELAKDTPIDDVKRAIERGLPTL
ncbi:MAG: DUF1003 domain-containing protein [Gemmatimonadota bacterium]